MFKLSATGLEKIKINHMFLQILNGLQAKKVILKNFTKLFQTEVQKRMSIIMRNLVTTTMKKIWTKELLLISVRSKLICQIGKIPALRTISMAAQ